MTKQTNNNGASLGFEAQLWAAADKLRGNMDPSDYRHVALGLIFLKHISDAFEARRAGLLAEEMADPEDPVEYLAENVLWGPKATRKHIFEVIPCKDVSGDLLFFLLKWLKPKFAEMAGNKQTTCLGRVTTQDLNQTFVDVPGVEEQANVVGIIGPIQNEIDLNRRMNKTLKAIAQAIFKDWLVEFGPTHPVTPAAPLRRCRAMAPRNGESATGMEKISRFGNGGVVHRGRRPISMYNCPFLPSKIQSSESNKTQFHGGEVLTDRTSIVTKILRKNWKAMGQIRICLASKHVIHVCRGIARPLLDLVGANILELRTPVRIRDLLASKLTSGEIRLPDVKRVVKAVA